MSFLLKRLPFSSFFRKSTMGSIEAPTKILVIGGSYGGLAAALNLYDLCNGKQARTTLWRKEEPRERPTVPVEIKIVDERDGYCEISFSIHAVEYCVELGECKLTNTRSCHRHTPRTGLGIVCGEGLDEICGNASTEMPWVELGTRQDFEGGYRDKGCDCCGHDIWEGI